MCNNFSYLVIVQLELPEGGQRREVLNLLDQVPAEAQSLNLGQTLQVFDLGNAAVVQIDVDGLRIEDAKLFGLLLFRSGLGVAFAVGHFVAGVGGSRLTVDDKLRSGRRILNLVGLVVGLHVDVDWLAFVGRTHRNVLLS